MRYTVVFGQQGNSYAVGFDDARDAIAFLFWGYEERELLPHGIFDALTGDVMPYEHHGQPIVVVDTEAIIDTAKAYLQAAIR